MEESNLINNIYTDEDTQCVYDGIQNLKECYIGIEDSAMEHLEEKTSTTRKASVGYGTVNNDEEEQWIREPRHTEGEQKDLQISVIEKEEFKYIGEVKDQLREGFGVCYYKNGSVFKGTWRNDKREGLGVLVNENGSVMKGEIFDDNFNGFCEYTQTESQRTVTGFYRGNRFSDYVIVKQKHKIFEGENYTDSDTKISIGKIYSLKKGMKVYMGEVYDYSEECGYGILINNNSFMYLGEIRNKVFENYIEMYNSDGAAYFGSIKNNFKKGMWFSFYKDGKVSFGNYFENSKNGPFLTFSNCHNLAKSSVRLEIFHLDFKSKFVDKMEPSKKYIQLNYPEYNYILNINYQESVLKFNEVLSEEMAYFNGIIIKDKI